jgi:hypothetical protein
LVQPGSPETPIGSGIHQPAIQLWDYLDQAGGQNPPEKFAIFQPDMASKLWVVGILLEIEESL